MLLRSSASLLARRGGAPGGTSPARRRRELPALSPRRTHLPNQGPDRARAPAGRAVVGVQVCAPAWRADEGDLVRRSRDVEDDRLLKSESQLKHAWSWCTACLAPRRKRRERKGGGRTLVARTRSRSRLYRLRGKVVTPRPLTQMPATWAWCLC